MNEDFWWCEKKAGLDHSQAGGNSGSGADVLTRKLANKSGGCTIAENTEDGVV